MTRGPLHETDDPPAGCCGGITGAIVSLTIAAIAFTIAWMLRPR